MVAAIEEYLKPFVVGKDVHDIEDIWQASPSSPPTRRSGPVLNAMSGIDIALWDIKGKLAGMPVYQLLGGKTRRGVGYVHASGSDFAEVDDDVQRTWIRFQVHPLPGAVPGSSTYGVGKRLKGRSGRTPRSDEGSVGSGRLRADRCPSCSITSGAGSGRRSSYCTISTSGGADAGDQSRAISISSSSFSWKILRAGG